MTMEKKMEEKFKDWRYDEYSNEEFDNMQLIGIVQHVTKAILTIACVHNVKDFYTLSILMIGFCSYGY